MRANSDILDWAKGRVGGHFINLETGETRGNFEISNVITYAAADIMARVIGGDTRYLPGYIGFVYGEVINPGPALIEPPVSRDQNWDSISTELADVTGNILIAPFSAGAAFSVDPAASTYYDSNAVTLTAHSGSRLEYAFPTSSPYADELADLDYFWHAMLITRIVTGNTIEYIPFARVTLKDPAYPQKPVGFELALFWQVSYF
jgi:hypothetical protein